MVEYIKEVQLVAIRNATYTIYVFKNINESEYIMCTRLPNWQVPEIIVGAIGFLQYHIVNAGDEYVNAQGVKTTYMYSNSYFINFVNKSDVVVKNGEITL